MLPALVIVQKVYEFINIVKRKKVLACQLQIIQK
jgi:hypothetical protein